MGPRSDDRRPQGWWSALATRGSTRTRIRFPVDGAAWPAAQRGHTPAAERSEALERVRKVLTGHARRGTGLRSRWLRGPPTVEALTEVHGEVVFGTTKTHQRRSVPIPRSLAEELAAQVVGKGPEDLVFTSPGCGVLRNTKFRPRVFDPACERAGLSGLTPHELRHTAASLAVEGRT